MSIRPCAGLGAIFGSTGHISAAIDRPVAVARALVVLSSHHLACHLQSMYCLISLVLITCYGAWSTGLLSESLAELKERTLCHPSLMYESNVKRFKAAMFVRRKCIMIQPSCEYTVTYTSRLIRYLLSDIFYFHMSGA